MASTIEHKKVEWIELFFDLTYVVAIAALTHTFIHHAEHHHLAEGYTVFFSMMAVLWWTWSQNTIYADRFVKGDAYYNLVTIVQMAFILALSLYMEDPLGEQTSQIAYLYVGVRLCILALYARVHLTEPDKRTVTGKLIAGLSLSGLLWLISAFLDPSIAVWLWVAGVFVDLLTGYLVRSDVARVAPPNVAHLPERMGLLAMIILGEAIVGVAADIDPAAFWAMGAELGRFILSFAAVATVWWGYFALSDKHLAEKIKGNGQDVVRLHYFIYAGIGLFAATIHLFTRAHTEAGTLIILLAVSLALTFLPMLLLARRHG